MTEYGFFIQVDPLPWMRPADAFSRKRNRIVRVDPSEQTAYKKYVGWQCLTAMRQSRQQIIPAKVPVELECAFMYPRPKSIKTGVWKPTKPDLSNLIKNVEDALNKIAWADDGQVVRYGNSGKFYTDGASVPYAAVMIRSLPNE